MNIFLTNVNMALASKSKPRAWLCRETGIGISTMSNWYQFDRFPGVDDAFHIATTLGVTLDSMMSSDFRYAGQPQEKAPAVISTVLENDICEFVLSLSDEQQLEVLGALKMALVVKINNPEARLIMASGDQKSRGGR
jgi:transcriptional regulator with XRE-family HTH domain